MPRTRYDKMLTQFNADMGVSFGEAADSTRLDQWLSLGVEWFSNLHPEGWQWMRAFVAIDNKDENLEVIATGGGSGADWPELTVAPLPRLNSMSNVRVKHGGSDDWKPLKYWDWWKIVEDPRYNRTAGTTELPDIWSVKVDLSGATGATPVTTIEVFPFSYAVPTLDYEIDYLVVPPTVTGGDAADDAFLWDDPDWDYVVIAIAEMWASHEYRDEERFNRSAALAEMWAHHTLRAVGRPTNRIILPPARAIRQVAVTEGV